MELNGVQLHKVTLKNIFTSVNIYLVLKGLKVYVVSLSLVCPNRVAHVKFLI